MNNRTFDQRFLKSDRNSEFPLAGRQALIEYSNIKVNSFFSERNKM